MKGCLNRNQLKYVAIIAMIIDHIAWAFVPTWSLLGQVMHIIGRLTAPIMAYMIAEGYAHTRDVKKYALRLGLFAILSWPAFTLFEMGKWPKLGQSVIFPLFLGLIAIIVWEKKDIPEGTRIFAVIMLCLVSLIGDWAFMAVLWSFYFYLYRDDPKKKWIAFSIIAAGEVAFANLTSIGTEQPFRQLFQFGVFLAIPVISFMYNGESGSKAPFHKWFFYIFYPAHMLILFFIKWKLGMYN